MDVTGEAVKQQLQELEEAIHSYWEQVDRLRLMSSQYQHFGLRLKIGHALQLSDLEALPELQDLREAIAKRDHYNGVINQIQCASKNASRCGAEFSLE